METEYDIHVITSTEIKTIKITEVTPDEAMAFAIVLFQKYARVSPDAIVLTSLQESKVITLNPNGRVSING